MTDAANSSAVTLGPGDGITLGCRSRIALLGAPEAAAAHARLLVSEETQRISAIGFGLAPTLGPLYRDAAVLAASPVFGKIAELIPLMRLPPVGRYGLAYLDLSDRVSETVRALLRGETEAEEAAAAIARIAHRASRQVE